jgi:hypothetical protein
MAVNHNLLLLFRPDIGIHADDGVHRWLFNGRLMNRSEMVQYLEHDSEEACHEEVPFKALNLKKRFSWYSGSGEVFLSEAYHQEMIYFKAKNSSICAYWWRAISEAESKVVRLYFSHHSKHRKGPINKLTNIDPFDLPGLTW